MNAPPESADDELERLRHRIQGQFGGRLRDFTIRPRDGGLALAGRAGSFHVKQLVQEAVSAASPLRVAANEIEVD